MEFKIELPEKVSEIIKNTINDEKIILDTDFDVSREGKIVDGWLVLTDKKLLIVEGENIIYEKNISSIKEFKIKEFKFSEGFCVHEKDEEKLLFCLKGRDKSKFKKISNFLNCYINGQEFKEKNFIDNFNCTKCGRKLNEYGVCTHCMDKKGLLKPVKTFIKDNTKFFVILTIMYIIESALTLLIPYTYRVITDDYLIGKKGPYSKVVFILIGVFILTIIQKVFQSFEIIASGKLSVKVKEKFRNDIYEKISKLSISSLSKKKTGDIMNRITWDVDCVNNFISNQLENMMATLLNFVGISIILFVTNAKLAFVILAPIPFVFIFIYFIRKTVQTRFIRYRVASDKVNSVLQDIISGIRVVKSFGREKDEVKRFAEASANFRDVAYNNEKMFAIIFRSIWYFIGCGQFLVMYYGGKLVLGGELQVGQLMQYTAYVFMLYGPLNWMVYFVKEASNFMTALYRIDKLLNEEEEELSASNKSIDIEGNIKIENLTFAYEEGKDILKNISLDVKSGEMIGIVGHSGAGKSTLINLIMKLYKPESGNIKIDGVDIWNFSDNCLRENMGIVLQENYLFSGTILDNIRYAKKDASLEEVIRASKIANAHDFIMKLPDAYNTKIGERGYNLSGGERQRVAIARAVLSNPKLLILDEATSALDLETESEIQDALVKLTKGKTTFAIAHRLSTLKNADRILVLDKGKVSEIGSHLELMKKKGLYYELVMAQREVTKVKTG